MRGPLRVTSEMAQPVLWVGRSEVPTQRDRPTQSASMHVSLRRALRRVLCLTETEIRLTAHLSETVFCLTEVEMRRIFPLSETENRLSETENCLTEFRLTE
jgi:hypothetical protein